MATENEEKRKSQTEESGQNNFEEVADLSLILQEFFILMGKRHEPSDKTGKDLKDADVFPLDKVLVIVSKKLLIVIQRLLNILRSPKRKEEIFVDLVRESEDIRIVRRVLVLLNHSVLKRWENTPLFERLEHIEFLLLEFSLDIDVNAHAVLEFGHYNTTSSITEILHGALDLMGYLRFTSLNQTECVPMLGKDQLSFQRDLSHTAFLRNFTRFHEVQEEWKRSYWNFPQWRESGNMMKLCEDINAKLKTIHTMQEGKLAMGSEQGTSKETSREEYKISNFDDDWNETDNLMKLLEDDLNLKLKSDLPRQEKILVATLEKETSTGRRYEEHEKISSMSSLHKHVLESDDIVSKFQEANLNLELLKQDISSQMRQSGSEQKQTLISTMRETPASTDTSFADKNLEGIEDDHSRSVDENRSVPDNAEVDSQGLGRKMNIERKTPAEYEPVLQTLFSSVLFYTLDSLIADFTYVLEHYNAFQRTGHRVLHPRSKEIFYEAPIMTTEVRHMFFRYRVFSVTPPDEQSLEETSVPFQSSHILEVTRVLASLLSARSNLIFLKMALPAKYIDRLQTVEHTLEFALEHVGLRSTQMKMKVSETNPATPLDLRNEKLSQTDEEVGFCSDTDNQSSAEPDRDNDALTLKESENEDANSSGTPYSSSTTLFSMTLNIPLLEPGTFDLLLAPAKVLSHDVSGAGRTHKDLTSQDWLSKDSRVTSVNLLSTYSGDQATQTQCGHQQEPPSPIVSKHWQATASFSSAGGTLKTPYSDVSLRVPGNAVKHGEYVDVHAAVSTDLELAQQLVKMTPEEYIVGPIAEYWAGENFQFEKPVCIIIPHFLPTNADLEMIRVYRVSKHTDGRVFVTRIRHVSNVNITEPAETQTDFAQNDDAHQGVKTEGDLLDQTSIYGDGNLPERLPGENHLEWDDGASFFLSSDGKFYISTIHFSFYVCTDCGCRRERPALSIMACGLRERHKNGQQTVDIAVLVGDKRLCIADFHPKYANGRPCLTNCTFALPSTSLKDSYICMRLRTTGTYRDMWRHCLVSNNEIGLPEDQYLSLDGLISCDKCTQRNTEPQRREWMLESKEDQDPDIFLCVVDICHVPADNDPAWCKKSTHTMSLMVKETIRSSCGPERARLLLELDIRVVDEVARKLKIPEEHIYLLRQKCKDDLEYKNRLSELCLAEPDCSEVLNFVLSKQTFGQQSFPKVSAQSRRDIFKNKNSSQQLLEIENSSIQSSVEEPSRQANQVNSAISLEEPKTNYVVGGTRNQLNTFRGNSTNGSSTSGSNTSSPRFASNCNFFNSDLVSGVDRLPALPLANNSFNRTAIQQLNNLSLIPSQRQLQPLNVDPEEASCLEQALPEIPFDMHDQFPDLNSHSTQS